MTGLATGLALDGRTVFTYSIANFPTLRCLEQIRNDAAYHGANVKIVAIGGGFSYGALGMSHHADRGPGNLAGDPGNHRRCAGRRLGSGRGDGRHRRDFPGVCYLRLDKSTAGNTARPDEVFRLGEARRLRDGSAITLIACGGILALALDAAERLAADGVECRVLSMHTIKPIDRAAVLSAASETGGIVTIEEHVVDGGLGGAVAEVCMEAEIFPRAFHRIGLRGGFADVVGSQEYLRERYDMSSATIVARVRACLDRGRATTLGVYGNVGT